MNTEKIDFSFEEAKLRIASSLKKLKDLDDVRRKLNEQLFLLDLQQEVSIKRYKKYLQMIGEHQQKENNRYISSQNDDESNSLNSLNSFLESIKKEIPAISSQSVEDERITNAKIKLEQYKTSINQKKELYLNLTKQDTIVSSILADISSNSQIQKDDASSNDDIPENDSLNLNDTIGLDLETLMNKIYEQKGKKAKLQKQLEGVVREVTIMIKIEKEMQNQLLILQKQASRLVERRKWHPKLEINFDISIEPKFTVYQTSLSIP